MTLRKFIEYFSYLLFKKQIIWEFPKDWDISDKYYQPLTIYFSKIYFSLEDDIRKRNFTTNSSEIISSPVKVEKSQELSKTQSYLNLPKMFEDLKLKVTTSKPEEKLPKWKTHPPTVTLEGIKCRTGHILSSISSAVMVPSRLKRLEELLDHLIEHPEAQIYAVKEGAIRTLLFLRSQTTDTSTLQVIQQILATIGYVEPPKSRGIRILSIDGGGMRGIAVIRMLQKLEELSGKRIYELFDYVCGVSTGAIIACSLIPPNIMKMDDVFMLYRELSTKVFKQSAFWGTSKLVWSQAYYDTALWEKLLKAYVGDIHMIETVKNPLCPKVAAISTIVNFTKVSPFIFRNYARPCTQSSEYYGSYKHTLFEAVRASAAAPTIFGEFRIGDMVHQDGGIVVNNPTAVALHEAKMLWPDESVCCVVSCGTGKYEPLATLDDIVDSSKSSWKRIFDKILESATDTEAVHTILNDLLPENVYYRLNPPLSRIVTMDEVSAEKLSELEEDTLMYCRRNEEKFNEITRKLTQPRSYVQKINDLISCRKKMYMST